jgi:FkbM family methyltransferase
LLDYDERQHASPGVVMLGGRTPGFVARQLLEPANYRALLALARVSPQPLRFARAYYLGGGSYPAPCPVRTPAGVVAPTVYSHHDVITVNEVFCRGDYRLPAGARVVVDIGSNIGISALYFLTRSAGVRVHLFEPDPRNAQRLRANLEAFAGRWTLHEEAVADRDGIVSFGREETGRYGGIGVVAREQIQVRCRHVNDVLRPVLESQGRIDLLKIDTEGLENATVAAIDRALVRDIGVICFETRTPLNPWPERFRMTFAAETCRLSARSA